MKDKMHNIKPRCLHMLLIKLNKTHRRRALDAFSKIGITEGQPKILKFLSNNDGCIQRQLSESCLIEPATVTSILANMEKLELIYRVSNTKDRRVQNVFLTAKGREAHMKAENVFIQIDEDCFTGFTEDERIQTLEYFYRLFKNIEKRGDANA